MDASSSHFIQTPLTKWHIRHWGDEKNPKIFCLHGLFGDSQDFNLLAQILAPNFHVIAPDLWAHGKTFFYQPATTLHFLDELKALIKVVNPDYWLGYSLGGRLLLQTLSTLAPQKHIFVLASDPGNLSEDERHKRLQSDGRLLEKVLSYRQSLHDFFKSWYQAELFGSLAFGPHFKHMMITRLGLDPKLLQPFITITSLGALPDTQAFIARNQHLITYFSGMLDQKYGQISRNLKVLFPKISTYEIPDASHALLWQGPEAIAAIINNQKIS